MTLFSLAYKNVKGNLNKYIMYYLSNVIIITIFFVFANFMYNPHLSGDAQTLAKRLTYLCEFVIVIFTFVFTTYSISNFIKSRGKEFALLSMFGLTKDEIRAYIMFENLIITIISIVSSLILGILFSKLFFIAVATILNTESQIPFNLSFKAIYLTFFIFLIFFQLICFITISKIKNHNIAKLLKEDKLAKPAPEFSSIKAASSIILVILGYIIALNSHASLTYTMFPVLIIIVIGTYLLFSQFSVFFTTKLQNKKSLYYNGTNMIALSQIVYKLKDNAKVMFITSILVGFTLTTSVSVYSLQKISHDDLIINYPQDISFIEHNITSHHVISNKAIEITLKKYRHPITYRFKTQIIKAQNTDSKSSTITNTYKKTNSKDFNIISQSSYNKLARQYNKNIINLKSNEVVIYSYVLSSNPSPLKNKQILNLNIGGNISKWKVNTSIAGGIINADSNYTNTIIINDNAFKKLSSSITNNNKYIYYGYNIKNSFKATNAVKAIKKLVTKGEENSFTERITNTASVQQFISIFLFIGTFVSITFFIATGSILYFKMFNEISEDKLNFICLKKLGMTKAEIKKVVTIQCLIIFFLPFLVAFSHSAFAIKSLGILYINYFLIIFLIYFIVQCIFYKFSKWMYLRQINY